MTRPASLVLALDIGGTKLAAGVATADGVLRRRASEPTDAHRGAVDALDRALALAGRVLAEEHAEGAVRSIGVATMGTTYDDHVEMAPNVPGWSELSLPATVRAAFPDLSVAIDNDVKAATAAEMAWGALAGVDHGIYLNLGTGIAAGVVVDGRLVRGAHGAAGEVGYSLPHGRVEARMAAEGAAPFEEHYGGAGVARRAAAALGRPASMADLLGAADEDVAARGLLDEVTEAVSVLVANLCHTLDPRVVAVGGGYVRGGPGLVEHIRRVVERAVPAPPSVVAARFGADAALLGAVALAVSALGEQP